MTFASNLATGDVIDFVQILGNVLDIGQPSDDTVTAAKLNNDVISGQTALTSAPADTDELLISDAGTIKRIDVSLVGGKNTPRVSVDKTGSSQTISATTYTKVTLNTERVDSDNAFASNDFTVPSGEGGDYYMSAFAMVTGLNGTSDYAVLRLANSGNSTNYNSSSVAGNSGYGWRTISISCIRTLSAGDTVSLYVYSSEGIAVNEDNANLTVIKLI